MSGLMARTASSPMPMRSAAPGRKFCTKASALAMSVRKIDMAGGCFRSKTMERLPRLFVRKAALTPPRAGPATRIRSPLGASTFTTSAPWSAKSCVA